MSAPAGWYDDGSGRQRWWDGSRWTENYAPAGEGAPVGDSSPSVADTEAAAAPAALAYAAGAPAPVVPKPAPVLGFVGLGLAMVGTVLVCVPSFVTFGIGSFLLLAGFVVSLVGVFKRGTVKWPSIVGIALSIIGGVVGVIVLVFTLIASIPTPDLPTAPSSSPAAEQPSGPPATGDSAGRPSPEALGKGYKIMINKGGYHQYDDKPEFLTCVGQHFYDSDLPVDVLRDLAEGVDNTTGAIRDQAIQIGTEALGECRSSTQ